ncbi:MAG: chemotaxis response regulator protein-glutamate methylesterase [Clostridiales bacterium]|nr:chemotaxis response regulator protein-glutamate methylesterase [Clostridiales bacterium]
MYKNNAIRLLIVEDSAFMRKILTDIFEENSQINVIGHAKNGKEGVEKVLELKPDIVTMDVEMPIMNGIDALREIMKKAPLPVVMLSSHTSEGAEATIQALEIGAVNFVQKPSSALMINPKELKEKLTGKIIEASKARLVYPIVEKRTYKHVRSIIKNTTNKRSYNNNIETVVAIGTSTGGPRALQYLLAEFPSSFPAPLLIVQHMPKGFTKSLANRLDSFANISVKEAEDGEILRKGYAYIAPGDYHLKVKRNDKKELVISLSKDKEVSGHRPSVDVMFRSLSTLDDLNTVGAIMTGMGADGASGLKDLKKKRKAYVIAQEESSCVVFGMPKSAIENGVVDEIVPLSDITWTILNKLEV